MLNERARRQGFAERPELLQVAASRELTGHVRGQGERPAAVLNERARRRQGFAERLELLR